eukprot:scaffold15816_cov70-Cyclotella_meneghiniana.AAC.2
MEIDDLPSLTSRYSSDDPDDSDESPSSKSLPVLTRRRRSFPLKLKKHIVAKVDAMRARDSSLTVTKAMEHMGYRNFYYSRWKRDIKVADEILSKRIHVDATTVPGFIPNENNHRKIHTGKLSILEPYAKQIQDKVFALRDRGLQVGLDTVIREASRLSLTFKNKTAPAKRCAASRFIKRIGLSYRTPKFNNLGLGVAVVVMSEFAAGRIWVMGGVHVNNCDHRPIVPSWTVPRSILALRKGNPTAVAVVRQYDVSRNLLLARVHQTQPHPNTQIWSPNNKVFTANGMFAA